LWAQVIDLAPAESQVPSSPITERNASGAQESVKGAAPQKAYDLLAKLQQRGGEPLPGYVGGRDFQNRERRLPHGRYREYDVNRKIPGRSRNAERLIIERKTGKAYYTSDHYRSFIPLN
jgi:ribonuclease T1